MICDLRDEFDVDGAPGVGDRDRTKNLSALQVPNTNAAPKIQTACYRIERASRTNKVAGDHQIEIGTDGDAVGIEAILGWIFWMFGDDLEILVEFHNSAGSMALRAAHHGDQKAATGQGFEIIGDRGKRRFTAEMNFGSLGLEISKKKISGCPFKTLNSPPVARTFPSLER